MNSSIINSQLSDPPAPRGPVKVRAEVTPGKIEEVEIPAEMLERYVMVKMVPVPGKPGVFRAMVKHHETLVPVTEDLGERLGCGLERRQILALAAGGFIDGFRATTATSLINPAQLWDHIYSTRLSTDEDGKSFAQKFWTAEKIRHYSDAAEFVRACGVVSAERRAKAGEVPHLEFDFSEPEESKPNNDKAA